MSEFGRCSVVVNHADGALEFQVRVVAGGRDVVYDEVILFRYTEATPRVITAPAVECEYGRAHITGE